MLTEDGADGGETADFDVAPFFSQNGTLHFLRSGPDPFSFNIIEFGDTPIPLGSLEAEGFPNGARRDPVGGNIVVDVGGAGGFTSIAPSTSSRGPQRSSRGR